MSTLTDVGDRADWRCWFCDEPVGPDMSVNDARGPNIDAVTGDKPKKGAPAPERLAHRSCNTRKGALRAVVPWSSDLVSSTPRRTPFYGIADAAEDQYLSELIHRAAAEGRAISSEPQAWSALPSVLAA